MIGAPVPGVVNALQVTIPGRLPSVPSVKALGNARDEKKAAHNPFSNNYNKHQLTSREDLRRHLVGCKNIGNFRKIR